MKASGFSQLLLLQNSFGSGSERVSKDRTSKPHKEYFCGRIYCMVKVNFFFSFKNIDKNYSLPKINLSKMNPILDRGHIYFA